jgi:hypothetical protein
VLPRGTNRIRRGDVHVRYGTPVRLPAAGLGPRADNRATADAIMAAISAMLPPEYRAPSGAAAPPAA